MTIPANATPLWSVYAKRGIRFEKNFKGAEVYLNGLVTKTKVGRRNHYLINTPAVEGLLQAVITLKHTPAVEGASKSQSAVEGAYAPALEANTPVVEGANSSVCSSVVVHRQEPTASASAPAVPPLELSKEGKPGTDGLEDDSQNSETPTDSLTSTVGEAAGRDDDPLVQDGWEDDDENGISGAPKWVRASSLITNTPLPPLEDASLAFAERRAQEALNADRSNPASEQHTYTRAELEAPW